MFPWPVCETNVNAPIADFCTIFATSTSWVSRKQARSEIDLCIWFYPIRTENTYTPGLASVWSLKAESVPLYVCLTFSTQEKKEKRRKKCSYYVHNAPVEKTCEWQSFSPRTHTNNKKHRIQEKKAFLKIVDSY